MAGNFIKCPRCDLNYLDKTKQTYCDVCLAELKLGPSLKFADLEEEDDEFDALELCPKCKKNYMKYNASLCDECLKAKRLEKDEPDLEEDESWRDFIEDETVEEDDGDISLSDLEDEENLNAEEDEEYDDYLSGDDELDNLADDFEDDFDDDDFDDDDEDDDDDF